VATGTATVERLDAQVAEDRQRRVAGALAAAGCGVGDRVAFCMPSSRDLLCAILGAARSGVIPVLLNASLMPAEREAQIADADPRLTVTDTPALAALFEGTPRDLSPYPLTRSMHYTSGTTGRPKGVTTGTWDEETARAVFEDEADVWGFAPDDVHLVCSPMHHTVTIRFAAGTLLRGGSLVILSRYDAQSALSVLRDVRPTTTFMVPTHLQRLLALEELGEGERFDSLRFLAHAGAPCPPALKRAVMERVRPDALYEFYGSTEAQFTVCPPEDWLERPGTVGRARKGRRLTIEPLDDEVAGPGSVGAIWCAVPEFARFWYWRDDAATQQAWRGDRLTVGDLGHLDEDGFLFLSGRRHDLIISGGVNVYPAEVEAVLAEMPGVEEVGVFGLVDAEWESGSVRPSWATSISVSSRRSPRPGSPPSSARRAISRHETCPIRRPASCSAARWSSTSTWTTVEPSRPRRSDRRSRPVRIVLCHSPP
jgi:acyl-CoA synthetase (AMP-forming)/AMP-acid ligase II